MDRDLLYRLLGERIRGARERKGFSQRKLADLLGMNRTSIVNIEQGRQRAPLHKLWEIAEELGTEASALVPKKQEFSASQTQVDLDQATIDEINKQAAGDPETNRKLQEFVRWAKARGAQ